MCCIALLILLGLFAQIALSKSLMEPNSGCTDFCIKTIKSVLDQQLMIQLQMKNIENKLKTQQEWAETQMNHQDKLETKQKLEAVESRLKTAEDSSSMQLRRLDSVEHKLIEHQKADNSGENGLLEMIERVKQNLSDQQEKNDSDMGRLSEGLRGLEKQITGHQERESLATERIGRLEDKQRQLVLGAQQVLERLAQIEKQIAVEHAKGQLERVQRVLAHQGKSGSHLDKYRERLSLIEQQFSGKENETLVTKRLDSLEKMQGNITTNITLFAESLSGIKAQLSGQQLADKRQKIESEVSKVKNQLADHQTKLENDEKRLLDSQNRLAKLQDQLTNQQKKVTNHEAAMKESESKVKRIFATVQKHGSEGNKLTEVVNALKNQLSGQQTKLENDDRRLIELQEQLTSQQNKMSTHEAAIKESESRLRTLWQKRLVTFQKLGSKFYYFERNEKLNWTDARDRCQELGSHLASLQDQQEFDLVTKDLYDVYYYWIDVNDIETEGVYMSSTTGKQANFLKWRQIPDDWKGNEDCVELAYESKANAMGMNDVHCSEKHMYICEK
ncbi:C-type lectin domain family 4 member M-like [Drosophila guanche]|uniref:Blast:Myosin-2 heavy chain n=1 Tax=Drosophila guanche TaxID=7266 RepID=A0A3B0KFH4_DROGU|nr:C-type lectin domain family 4 member M-like [Drosophila guanche]SPP82378.1 blast:Myosin-2 heavy chain [Drosophila guanche]